MILRKNTELFTYILRKVNDRLTPENHDDNDAIKIFIIDEMAKKLASVLEISSFELFRSALFDVNLSLIIYDDFKNEVEFFSFVFYFAKASMIVTYEEQHQEDPITLPLSESQAKVLFDLPPLMRKTIISCVLKQELTIENKIDVAYAEHSINMFNAVFFYESK